MQSRIKTRAICVLSLSKQETRKKNQKAKVKSWKSKMQKSSSKSDTSQK